MTNRPLVIYHADCADGFGAVWCFWSKYKDGADYFPGHHGEAAPNVTDRDVYLVDFSYKRDVVATMLKLASSVTLIDHHISAIKDLEGLVGLKSYTSLIHSGSVLAWKFLNPNQPVPRLLSYVEDRDLWRFQLPDTKEVSAYVFAQPYDFEAWDQMIKKMEHSDGVESICQLGRLLLQKHIKDVKLVLKTQRFMVIDGCTVRVLNAPITLGSDAASAIAQGAQFAAYYYDTSQFRNFGLRSDPTWSTVDVSLIAAKYGGGGHKNASGFRVPRDHILARS